MRQHDIKGCQFWSFLEWTGHPLHLSAVWSQAEYKKLIGSSMAHKRKLVATLFILVNPTLLLRRSASGCTPTCLSEV